MFGHFFDNNYFDNYRRKGGSTFALLMSNYLICVLHNLALIFIFFGMIYFYGYSITQAFYVGLLWSITEPAFIFMWCLLFFSLYGKNVAQHASV